MLMNSRIVAALVIKTLTSPQTAWKVGLSEIFLIQEITQCISLEVSHQKVKGQNLVKDSASLSNSS